MRRISPLRTTLLALLAFLCGVLAAKAELDILAPATAFVMVPDCVISHVDRKTMYDVEVEFSGKLVVTGSDGQLVDTANVKNHLSIQNSSPDDGGAFDLFCDQLTASRGKAAFLDISTTEFRIQGSGVRLDFSRSHCEIRPAVGP
jgi:hypothetical protein